MAFLTGLLLGGKFPAVFLCYPPASQDVPNGEREPGQRLVDTRHALLILAPDDHIITTIYEVS